MKLNFYAVLIATSSLMFATVAFAQTPQSEEGAAQPEAASGPQQPNTTSASTPGADAMVGSDSADSASSHQREAANDLPSSESGQADPISSSAVSTQTFIQKASQDGTAELQIAGLALQKSQNDEVRDFAVQMQKDHRKAAAELQNLAARKHVPLATALDSRHQVLVDELNAKSGADFDTAYAKDMVNAHHHAVALFDAGTKSKDPDIAQFAAKTLPTLEGHQGMADGLEAKTKLAAADSAGAVNR
jgi:putative membrane protein